MNDSLVVEFLAMMGLDDDNSRMQATRLWSKLDKLHATDPTAYDEYISEQARNLKNLRSRDFITPDKGIAIKVQMADTMSDTIRIRDNIYINFCVHPRVKKPHNPSNTDLNTNSTTIYIPFVISPIRDTEDENGNLAFGVDIVSNPWCIGKALEDNTFMRNFVQLIIKSIQEEHRLQLTNMWNLLSSTYYHRQDGSQLEEVLPFPITADTSKHTLLNAMHDPSTFMRVANKESQSCAYNGISMMMTKLNHKVLIQDISMDQYIPRIMESGASQLLSKEPVRFRKGFLHHSRGFGPS